MSLILHISCFKVYDSVFIISYLYKFIIFFSTVIKFNLKGVLKVSNYVNKIFKSI